MATRALKQLEEQVRQVENRTRWATATFVAAPASTAAASAAAGAPPMDWPAALTGAVPWPRGAVHEWFADAGPPLAILGRLAEAARLAEGGVVVWIGRSCWPYPPGVAGGPGPPGSPDRRGVGEGSLRVDPSCDADRLWAIELCARSPAVAAVVADGRRLDMTATRRLQLAARDGGARLLLARPGRERDRLSAAAGRWRVAPEPSPTCHPRWIVELLRCKGLPPRQDRSAADPPDASSRARWIVESRHDTGLVLVSADLADRPTASSPAAWQRRIA